MFKSKPKVRKSKSYLIISSCHLGLDKDIVDVFSSVSKYYGSEVIHVGPTANDADIKAHASLEKRYRSLSKKLYGDVTERQEEKIQEQQAEIESQIEFILGENNEVIESLSNKFPGVKFVTNEKISLPFDQKYQKNVIKDGIELSKHLFLSAVPPRGVKATRNPFNKQAVSYLKQCGKNWIVGFPVPSIEPLPKPGLNESYNYWTVGMLTDIKTPYKHNEMYQSDHAPAAILVLTDSENGEFHACHMHIDYIGAGKNIQKVTMHDGLVFTKDKVFEVDSADKATMDTDGHAPHQHPGTLAAIRLINELNKPETYIDGGDSADFESVNRHAEGKPGATEGLRLVDDLNALRRFLDAKINVPSIKNKILIDSNHHEWVTNLILEKPILKGICDWDTLAEKYFSDWNVMLRKPGDNDIYYFGDYMIRHGDKDGGPKKAEPMSPHGKYVCGHFHRFMGYRRVYGQGCSAKLGPAYTGNQVNAWQSQCSTFTKFNNITAFTPKTVLHDKFKEVSRVAFRNKIYEVKHYKI